MKKSLLCASAGILLLLLGLLALFTLPLVLIGVIHSRLKISSCDPEQYHLWKDLPLPIYQRFYFFNVTNADRVMQKGDRPELKEVGPFTYKVSMVKQAVNFSSDLTVVSFREVTSYVFQRHLSSHDENTTITTLNGPLSIAMTLLDGLSGWKRRGVEAFIIAMNEKYFIDRQVKELLFDGYKDFLTESAHGMFPAVPPNTKFAWMLDKNNTDDGLFSVYTGQDNRRLINLIKTIDGSPELDYWSSSECNSLADSRNGEMYPPVMPGQRVIYFFRSNLCRRWPLITDGLTTISLGDLRVLRFLPDEHIFSSPKDYPPNACFTPKKNTNEEAHSQSDEVDSFANQLAKLLPESVREEFLKNVTALRSLEKSEDSKDVKKITRQGQNDDLPSGVFPLAACFYGAPIYFSFPHFFQADPSYLGSVLGLKPNTTEHQFYLDVEPVTGAPVYLAARLQINARITDHIGVYGNIPKIIMPVFWQEFTIRMTDQLAEQLNWTLTVPGLIITVVSALFVGSGALLLILVVACPAWKRICKGQAMDQPQEDEDRLVDNGNETGDKPEDGTGQIL